MLSKLIFILLIAFPVLASAPKDGAIQLTTQNTIVFRGEVTGSSVAAAQLNLARLVSKRAGRDYKLYLIMDSPGGSIMAGEAFIQFAKRVDNLETVTIFAASMGSAIVEALPGKRHVTENGILMFHRAKGQFGGQFEEGEVEQELALFKKIVRLMEQRNADRLNMTLAKYKSKVVNEYWAHSSDAVTENMVDSVTAIDCSMELIDSRVHLLSEGIFGESSLTFSGCPLIRSPILEPKQEREVL